LYFASTLTTSPTSSLPAGSMRQCGYGMSLGVWVLSTCFSQRFLTETNRQISQDPSRSLRPRHRGQLQLGWDIDRFVCHGWPYVRLAGEILPRPLMSPFCRRIWDADSGQCLKTLVDDDNPIWYAFVVSSALHRLLTSGVHVVPTSSFPPTPNLSSPSHRTLLSDFGTPKPRNASKHTRGTRIQRTVCLPVSA
jgi:hypothetical protein